jgi:hypothetical protein
MERVFLPPCVVHKKCTTHYVISKVHLQDTCQMFTYGRFVLSNFIWFLEFDKWMSTIATANRETKIHNAFVLIYISKSWPELHLTASNVPFSQTALTSSYTNMLYQEIDKYRMFLVNLTHRSVIHEDQGTACCGAHANISDNIWNDGKFSPLFTDHKRCWKRCTSTR